MRFYFGADNYFRLGFLRVILSEIGANKGLVVLSWLALRKLYRALKIPICPYLIL